MRRRRERLEPFPPHLAEFDPAAWVDRYHYAMSRWEWWQSHPELHGVVDPVELLRERRRTRLEVQAVRHLRPV